MDTVATGGHFAFQVPERPSLFVIAVCVKLQSCHSSDMDGLPNNSEHSSNPSAAPIRRVAPWTQKQRYMVMPILCIHKEFDLYLWEECLMRPKVISGVELQTPDCMASMLGEVGEEFGERRSSFTTPLIDTPI